MPIDEISVSNKAIPDQFRSFLYKISQFMGKRKKKQRIPFTVSTKKQPISKSEKIHQMFFLRSNGVIHDKSLNDSNAENEIQIQH